MWKSVLLKLHFIYLQITELYVFLSFEISFSLKKQVFESVLKPILGLFFTIFHSVVRRYRRDTMGSEMLLLMKRASVRALRKNFYTQANRIQMLSN